MWYLVLMSVCYFSFDLFFTIEKNVVLMFFCTILVFVHLCFILLIVAQRWWLNSQFNSDTMTVYFLSAYFMLMLLANLILSSLYWKQEISTGFIWNFLIPLAAAVYARRIKYFAMFWCVLTLIFVCLVFVITYYLPESFVLELTPNQIYINNIMTVIWFMFLFIYLMFISTKFNEMYAGKEPDEPLEASANQQEPSDVAETETASQAYVMSPERMEQIYSDIIKIFEGKRPYCNPDYSVGDLAKSLNTNVNYLNRVLRNYHPDMNFSAFVNMHRIQLVKCMINEGINGKYTLRYIYESSGFSLQPTFNKVFKQFEGITPSEYVSQVKAEIISN
jgi:AraC-like DNA-binding protein